MLRLFSIITAFVACSICSIQSAAADLSLAIVAEDQGAATAADLLTAELSAHPNLRILERAELQRILAEQRLSLLQSQDILAVGKLSGAEALLFLDHFTQSKGEGVPPAEFLGVRLILVTAGVVLDTVDFSWPPGDLSEWAASTAKYLQLPLARANLPEDRTIKLSLLNLRSPTDSRESRLLDQELNALLLKRLARETNILVLERQKLGATLLERELNSESSPFWRGSYLVDGTVNKLGYSTNQITLEGRVIAPGAQKTNFIQLAGAPSELSRIIDEFARESLKIAQSASSVSWDAAAEAARYFDEAAWALRWGLLPEAQSAADAAWALGRHDEPAATLRVQAYGRAARPQSSLSYTFPQRRRLAYSEPPQPGALANGLSALSIFMEWSARIPVENSTPQWLKAGHEALRHCSELLTVYYYTPEARLGLEGDLAELRSLCRQSADWMSRAPSNRAAFFLENPNLNFDQINQALEKEHLFKTMAEFGALWQERIAAALEMHRTLINAPAFCRIRTEYLGDFTDHTPVAGWTWNERQKALPLWRDFLLDLEKGTNLVPQIEAKMLRTRTLGRENERFTLIREIVETIRQNTNVLSQHPVLLNYEYHVDQCVPPANGLNMVTAERGKLDDELRAARNTVFEPLTRSQWVNVDRRKDAGLFDVQKAYLADRKTDSGEFARLFVFPKHFSKDQGETLLRMFPEYRTGLSNILATSEFRNQGRIRIALMQAEQAETRIASIIGKTNLASQPSVASSSSRTNRIVRSDPNMTGPTSPQRGVPPFRGPGAPGTSGGPPGRPFPSGRPFGMGPHAAAMLEESFVPAPIRTNTLVIPTFYEISPAQIPRTNIQFYKITGIIALDDEVWMRSRFTLSRPENGYNSEPSGAIIGFDAARGAFESIPTPFETVRFINDYAPLRGDFHFWKGDLYAAGMTQLQRYDRASRTWNALPVPLSRDAQVITADDRLLVLNDETILELQAGGAGAKTLVSSRRQPPITPLDSLTNLAEALVFEADKGFRVWVPPALYQFDGSEFSQLKTFTRPVQASRDRSGFLAVDGAPPRQGFSTPAHLLAPGDTAFRPAFSQLTRWFSPIYFPPNVAKEPENLRWKKMNQFSLQPELAIVIGEDLLMWGSPLPNSMPRATAQPQSVHPALSLDSYLFMFSKRFPESIVIDIEIAAGLPELREKADHRRAVPPRIFMTATKTHLVLGNTQARGLWFVPLANLAQCAEQARAPGISGGSP